MLLEFEAVEKPEHYIAGNSIVDSDGAAGCAEVSGEVVLAVQDVVPA